MRKFYQILTICYFICKVGHARRDGGIPNSACGTMLPGHGFDVQSSTSPYAVSVATSFFIPNITLQVHADVVLTSSAPFKGFYCQAREMTSPSTLAGYFSSLTDKQRGHHCFSQSQIDGSFNTVSHKSSWSSNPGTSVMLNWRTTNAEISRVTFRCTFVRSYNTYWVGVETEPIASMENVEVTECCETEDVASGCMPLCHHIEEGPDDMAEAQETLEDMVGGNQQCPFSDGQKALRCTYWSRTAQDFDKTILEDCCYNNSISSACMHFCNREIFGNMDYSEEDLNICMVENPNLAFCLNFPGELGVIYEDTTTTSFVEETTSWVVSSTSTQKEETSTTTPSFDVSSHRILSTASTLASTTVVSETTPSSTTTSTTMEDDSTTTIVATTTPTTVAATTPTVATTTTVEETTQVHTTFGITQKPSTGPPSTVLTTTPELTTTTAVEETTQSESTSETTQSTPVDTTPAPTESPGSVIILVNVTVSVTGAVQDADLRTSVFNSLQVQLLVPGLSTVAGYDRVRVGVQYYEGSLIVVSEALFTQQTDGSIPSLPSVSDALNSRLGAINNEIQNNGQSWSIPNPVQVTRKAINGACQSTSCGTQEVCVEVGAMETTCLCVDSSNNEIVCQSNVDSGLSAGAIAGIVIGCILVVLVIFIIVLCAKRRGMLCVESKDNSKPKVKRITSTTSDNSYVYPDTLAKEEPVYMDISSEAPPPPVLPPSRVPTLPSHSLTYETATTEEETPNLLTDLKKNEEGYMEAVLIEHKPESDPVNVQKPGENDYTEPYAQYQASVDEVTISNYEGDDYTEPYAEYQANTDEVTIGNSESSNVKATAKEEVENSIEASSDYMALDGHDFAGPTEMHSKEEQNTTDSEKD